MFTDAEQHQIIEQITSGDPHLLEIATRTLREKNFPTVRKIVRIGGSEEDIQTVLNDTVMDLIKIIRDGKYDPQRATLGGLAFTIVKNKWKDELKLRYRKHEMEYHYVNYSNDQLNYQNPIELKLFTKEEQQAVISALEQLKPEDRRLLKQKYLEGYTLRVIAKRMGVSEDAIKKRHERAKKRLRELLNEDPRTKD